MSKRTHTNPNLIPLLCAALLGALLSMTACKRPPTAAQPGERTAAVISAAPNPVPAGPGPGGTVIAWDTGDGSEGEVYAAIDGREEKLFAKNSKGSTEAPWIMAGSTYEFRLYKGTDREKLLGSVKVTRHK